MLHTWTQLQCDSCRRSLFYPHGHHSNAYDTALVAAMEQGWQRVHVGSATRDLCSECLENKETTDEPASTGEFDTGELGEDFQKWFIARAKTA